MSARLGTPLLWLVAFLPAIVIHLIAVPRTLSTIALAALDAALVVAIGLGILIVPLTLLWGVQFGLVLDWSLFWQASVDVWLLGHGVDLAVTVNPATLETLGINGLAAPFELGIALLGFAVLTFGLAFRTGKRLRLSREAALVIVSEIVTVALVSTMLAITAIGAANAPSLAQAIILPAAIYGLGSISGLIWGLVVAPAAEAADELSESSLLSRYESLSAHWRLTLDVTGIALRGATMVVATLLACAGILVSVLIFANFSSIIALYEGLQAGVLGGITLTIAELALVPNLVIWALSWLMGPGFLVGTANTVSPLGSSVDALPALPIFGAIPESGGVGFFVLLVPVLAALVFSALLRSAVAERAIGMARPWALHLGAGAGIGVLAAIAITLLGIASGGAMGPGRLIDVGPNPGELLIWALAILVPSAIIGQFSGVTRDADGFSETELVDPAPQHP